MGVVDEKRITQIAAMDDPIARNLAVTEAYHQLALAMRAVTGPADATWCAFAVWASNTAGEQIRMEAFPAAVRRHLEGSPDYHAARTRLGRWLDHRAVVELIDRVARTVSDAIAHGNTLVFSELAPLFSALANHGPDANPATGNDLLAEAVALYRQAEAAHPDDDTGRAKAVFHANCVAVFHEQTRLQSAIETALDAAPSAAFQDLARHRLAHDVAEEAKPFLHAVERELDAAWERTMTDHFMTLSSPGERLDLHKDVPPPPGEPLFPPELMPPFSAPLTAFLDRYNAGGDTSAGTGARDWRIIDQRMTYIVTLFRSRQRHQLLFDAPPLQG